jgi:hypothetical protein
MHLVESSSGDEESSPAAVGSFPLLWHCMSDLRAKDLTGQITKTEEHCVNFGTFTEIFKGEWQSSADKTNMIVAVKVLRGIHTQTDVLERVLRVRCQPLFFQSSILTPRILASPPRHRGLGAS